MSFVDALRLSILFDCVMKFVVRQTKLINKYGRTEYSRECASWYEHIKYITDYIYGLSFMFFVFTKSCSRFFLENRHHLGQVDRHIARERLLMVRIIFYLFSNEYAVFLAYILHFTNNSNYILNFWIRNEEILFCFCTLCFVSILSFFHSISSKMF